MGNRNQRDQRPLTVALLGGSFNPPHICHLMAALYALECRDCDEAWLVPVKDHVLGKDLPPFADRAALAAAMTRDYRPRLSLCDIENSPEATGYTVDTLELLMQRYPQHTFKLVLGADIRAEQDRWKDFTRIQDMVEIIWVGRAGHDNQDAALVLPDISSTQVRDLLARGADVTALVPAVVREEMAVRGLYGCGKPDPAPGGQEV